MFANKSVVVSGGTGALGTAVVTRLLDLGARVHIPVFSADEGRAFPHRDHERVTLCADVDLTNEQQVQSFYAKVGQAGMQLWASIHIAGGFDMAGVVDTTAAAFDKQMAMNAKSCFLCCREAVKAMGERSLGGRIVNVSARPGVEPRQGAGMVAYAASKAAVAAITQALGEEVSGAGIWVNAVAPSILDTPANRQAMADADFSTWPTPDQVAATIVHLASPDNGAARGAVVPVYGRV